MILSSGLCAWCQVHDFIFPLCLVALENHFEAQAYVSQITGNELEQIYKTDFGTKDIFMANDESSAKAEFQKKDTKDASF